MLNKGLSRVAPDPENVDLKGASSSSPRLYARLPPLVHTHSFILTHIDTRPLSCWSISQSIHHSCSYSCSYTFFYSCSDSFPLYSSGFYLHTLLATQLVYFFFLVKIPLLVLLEILMNCVFI